MPLDQSDPISQDPKVQGFLEETLLTDEGKYRILQELRRIVLGASKQISERMMYGGIMFSFGEDFGGIFASKKHVSFEFSLGHQLDDPAKHLEGTGKFRRHLKIRSLEDIPGKDVQGFVQQTLEGLQG
jgi:hypothetical protein